MEHLSCRPDFSQPLPGLFSIGSAGIVFEDLPVKLYRMLLVMLLLLDLGGFKELFPLVAGTAACRKHAQEN